MADDCGTLDGRVGDVSGHRGRWRARIRVGGRRVSLGIYDTPEEARAAVAAARHAAGIVDAPGSLSLGAWGSAWLDRREIAGRTRGIRQERSVWRTHVASSTLALVSLRAVTRPMIARWVTAIVDSGRSTQTAKHALRLVRSALEDAASEGQIKANPALAVRVPRRVADDATPAWTWLEQREIDALLASELAPQWARDVWAVAIYTGLRKGELAGLRWSDVEVGDRPHLRVVRSYRRTTKSGRGREVPLLPPALDAIRRQRARAPGVGGAAVWPSPSGGVRSPRWDPGGWRRYALGATRPRAGRALDRHVRFHDLRHTCASHLVQGTWLAAPLDLYRVGQWLGHSSTGVTSRYAHLAPGGLHDLAAGHRWDTGTHEGGG